MLLLNLKMHSAGRLPPRIFLARFHRSADLASRRTKATARLGMYVRFAIITGNLSMSIW
jgi:hypothetical protein